MSEPFQARLSYAEPDAPVWKRLLIRGIERLSGRPRIERLYREIRREPFSPADFWKNSLDALGVSLEFDADRLARISPTGPLVFIANHPFGIVDGLSLCYLAGRVRPRFQLLVNSVLDQDPALSPYMLPVDFDETREAARTNIRTKQHALETLSGGGAIVIFPGGGISTATGFFGPVEDLEWKRFTANLVQSAKATVVPVFFRGQNSRLFQVVSQFSLTLRLALLVREASRLRETAVQATIGEPIPYAALAEFKGRQTLLDELRRRTYALGDMP